MTLKMFLTKQKAKVADECPQPITIQLGLIHQMSRVVYVSVCYNKTNKGLKLFAAVDKKATLLGLWNLNHLIFWLT